MSAKKKPAAKLPKSEEPDQAELEDMPPALSRVKIVRKIKPVILFLETELPELGAPRKFNAPMLGVVTKVTHSTDKDGELWTVQIEEQEA